MQEEYARFHLAPDDGFTSAVAIDRTAVARSSVAMTRSRAGIVRRNPRRAIVANQPLYSTYAVTWDTDVCDDLPTLRMLMEALCDRDTCTAVTGGHEWQMDGASAGFRTFSAWAATEDGLSHRLHGGICREASITATTGTIAAVATTWEFQRIEAVEEGEPDTAAAPTAYAGSIECRCEWGGSPLTAWAVALNFSRDLAVADIDDTGVPRGYSGRPTVDIAGKMSCRVSSEDAAELFEAEILREFVLSMTAGTVTMTITLHRANFIITGRRVVGNGQIEHTIEFVATAGTGLPTATVSLVQS